MPAKKKRAPIPADTEVLTEPQTAKFLNLKSDKTLYAWRVKRCGPPYVQFGPGKRKLIRYRRADLIAWLDAQLHTAA